MVQQVAKELGTVDILVNNAGIFIVGTLLDTDEESWDRVINVNLKSCYLCSRAVVPGMMEKESGCIVSISSISGLSAPPANASYCASKAGVIMFTKQLAGELGQYNIRVNSVTPGAMITDWRSHLGFAGNRRPAGLATPATTAVKGSNPLNRIAEPGEIASAVLFLASDAASYVTGQTLVVDGGRLI